MFKQLDLNSLWGILNYTAEAFQVGGCNNINNLVFGNLANNEKGSSKSLYVASISNNNPIPKVW